MNQRMKGEKTGLEFHREMVGCLFRERKREKKVPKRIMNFCILKCFCTIPANTALRRDGDGDRCMIYRNETMPHPTVIEIARMHKLLGG